MEMVLKRESFCEGCQKDRPSFPCMVFDNEFESVFEIHNETVLRSQLNDLHTRIIRELHETPVTSKDFPEQGAGCTYYSRDGFMPGYTKAAKRILFIGRESRWSYPNTLDPKEIISDIIKNTYVRFLQDKTSLFEQRMLSIAAQLLAPNKYSSYNDIIWKNWSSVRNAVISGEIAFAYLELSKFGNCNDDPSVDRELMNQFADFDAIHSFGKQQIELLKPDVIITTNLMGEFYEPLQVMLGSHLVEFYSANEILNRNTTTICEPNLTIRKVQSPWDSSRFVPVLDVWHFTARKQNSDYFDPIKSALTKGEL
jgi:hypothetical protein